jgi:hypothetical protein
MQPWPGIHQLCRGPARREHPRPHIRHQLQRTPARGFLEQIHADLCTSISEVDGQIERYDELVEKTELVSKIPDFDVFSEARSLFFKGSARKFSRKRTEERYLVVFSDILLVAEPLPLIRKVFKVNKLYMSGEYNILPVDDCPPFVCAVDVRQQAKSFRVNMVTSDEKNAILAAFERVLQACGVSQGQLRMRGFAPGRRLPIERWDRVTRLPRARQYTLRIPADTQVQFAMATIREPQRQVGPDRRRGRDRRGGSSCAVYQSQLISSRKIGQNSKSVLGRWPAPTTFLDWVGLVNHHWIAQCAITVKVTSGTFPRLHYWNNSGVVP